MTQEKFKKAAELNEKLRVINEICTWGIESFKSSQHEMNFPYSLDEDCNPFFQELRERYQKEIEEL